MPSLQTRCTALNAHALRHTARATTPLSELPTATWVRMNAAEDMSEESPVRHIVLMAIVYSWDKLLHGTATAQSIVLEMLSSYCLHCA